MRKKNEEKKEIMMRVNLNFGRLFGNFGGVYPEEIRDYGIENRKEIASKGG